MTIRLPVTEKIVIKVFVKIMTMMIFHCSRQIDAGFISSFSRDRNLQQNVSDADATVTNVW